MAFFSPNTFTTFDTKAFVNLTPLFLAKTIVELMIGFERKHNGTPFAKVERINPDQLVQSYPIDSTLEPCLPLRNLADISEYCL